MNGRWLNIFPAELEIGDSWGERGEIVELHQDIESYEWRIVLCQPNGSTWVENGWPEAAPMRVFRPEFLIGEG